MIKGNIILTFTVFFFSFSKAQTYEIGFDEFHTAKAGSLSKIGSYLHNSENKVLEHYFVTNTPFENKDSLSCLVSISVGGSINYYFPTKNAISQSRLHFLDFGSYINFDLTLSKRFEIGIGVDYFNLKRGVKNINKAGDYEVEEYSLLAFPFNFRHKVFSKINFGYCLATNIVSVQYAKEIDYTDYEIRYERNLFDKNRMAFNFCFGIFKDFKLYNKLFLHIEIINNLSLIPLKKSYYSMITYENVYIERNTNYLSKKVGLKYKF